jgi:beta-lactamase class A
MLRDLILNCIDFSKIECGFVIKSLKTGEEVFYNEDEVVPSASTIKVSIMGEVLRQVKEGRLSLQNRITVDEKVKVPYSILTLLETGNSYSLKDVITLMIIQSDNTATNILIDLVGMESINKFAKEIGLNNTVLQRKMMDFNARKKGRDNYTTAKDMLRIFELMYKGELVDKNYSDLMLGICKNQLDNTMMKLYIPDETVIAHKTGELDFLDHDCGIVYHEKGDYIFSMLTWNAVSNNFARETIGRVSKMVYDYFNSL